MRNLVRLLSKYNHLFLFLIMEAGALLLLVNNNDYQRSSFMHSAGGISGGLFEWWNGMEDYFSLTEENERLAAENARLRQDLDNAFFVKLRNGTREHRDTVLQQHYRFVEAEVVNRTTTHQNNFFTINRGTSDSIEQNMGVIGPNGIVGFVRDVSENYATVVLVLNLNFRGSGATIENYSGQLKWYGDSPTQVMLENIPKHATLALGDSILTNQASGRFPAHIPIGTVIEVIEEPGSDYQKARLELTTDFNSIGYVYVVRNLLRNEREALEQQMNEDA